MHQLKGNQIFPLTMKSWTNDWTAPGNPEEGVGSFGSARPGRLHAACDLHVPAGTEVRAVANGSVFDIASGFPGNSKAIQVNHDGFVVLYGEVVPDSEVERGSSVTQGQTIATVANQGRESQLHFELYLNPGNKKIHVLLPAGRFVHPITEDSRRRTRRHT